jgi:hypothetical protein
VRKQFAEAQHYKKLQVAHKVLSMNMLRDRKFQGTDAEMWTFVDQAAKQLISDTELKKRKKSSQGKKRKVSLSNTTAKKNEDKIARDITKK